MAWNKEIADGREPPDEPLQGIPVIERPASHVLVGARADTKSLSVIWRLVCAELDRLHDLAMGSSVGTSSSVIIRQGR